jgi:hypothetical protein
VVFCFVQARQHVRDAFAVRHLGNVQQSGEIVVGELAAFFEKGWSDRGAHAVPCLVWRH